MASSAFAPQLLINEGELEEIVRMVKAAKTVESKVVGKLFGLWRNSLIQPVVQLVTGPGGRAKTSKKHFVSDDGYHHKIKKFLDCEHGLLQIGLWFSGNVDRYPRCKFMKLYNSLVSWTTLNANINSAKFRSFITNSSSVIAIIEALFTR